ncbi:hypothetical protein SAMN02927924_04357 [Sphingobium faniae]|nr:hypothetical protein SAMN02927924_04357 [Sphingobium faniae]
MSGFSTNGAATATMATDLSELRSQVRAMDFVRGTAEEVEQWRNAYNEAWANQMLAGTGLTIGQHNLLALLMEEGVPPSLVPAVLLSYYRNASV